MKKIFTVLLLLCATLVASAQEVPSSFPRKYLIEHFTGDECGYCPEGMYSIVEYTQKTSTPCIWVSHHYGYNTDEYTISESAKIASASGVSGAPNMAMNRTKVMGTSIAFHPGYLVEDGMAETIADKCDTTAEASVVIDHTYNAETRELNVTVSGQVADTAVTEYLLTVLIKENGLIGKQADYYWSWKTAGYKEFMHPCVARDLLCSTQLGDTVKVENQAYSKTYTYSVPEKWVAENCCVVAYITPLNKKPVINAEETPLVAGTTGGAEYLPFAITEAKEPTNATKLSFDTLELSKVGEDKLAVKLVAASSTRSDMYGPVKMVVYLEFNTTDSILPVDSLLFAEGNEMNTFTAGSVDLVEQSFAGSHLSYHLAADLEAMCHIWRIMSGNVVVEKNGSFVASGKLDNGKNFKVTCTLPETDDTAVEDVIFDQNHVKKLMRDGQILINIDGIDFDMQGRVIE
ncbi:MAG: Omp28-related outer membrane protein [Paludibacteraceae bacterium]|nr:Omp28-related outer membrane protein [Paludibacteraceae bacterium]